MLKVCEVMFSESLLELALCDHLTDRFGSARIGFLISRFGQHYGLQSAEECIDLDLVTGADAGLPPKTRARCPLR